MFINPNKTDNLQFEKAVMEFLFNKTMAEEYNRFDLDIRDSSTGLPIESFFQMINYDAEASFYRTVDLKKQLSI